MFENIVELFSYKEMLVNLVRKELRTRYKGSVLGFLWTFINPLLQLIVYSLVFATIMRMNVKNYPMFLFVVLLPWIFFQNSVLISTGCIVGNKDLVKKVYFPREVLPIAVATSGLMNLLFGFVIVFPCIFIFHIKITYSILYLPIIILIEYILTLGFSILFACLNVYFRDLEHILGIFMMAWFYLTPVIYPVDLILPYIKYFYINPMTPIAIAFRDILYYGSSPDLLSLLITFIAGLLLLIFSYNVFKRLERNFAEEI